jgi:hypothetical protein|tara:strand:- start:890 stop:1267 length:378 start_codon:yes stop_codon:yes gene_type:complete
MAHFAEINENNIVKQVIVINNQVLLEADNTESEIKGIDFCESLYGHRNWVQTSYNGNFRYNYAGIGYTWDADNNAFYAPQPYPSWTLDDNYKWQAPVPYPEDGSPEKIYQWNEENQEWKVIEITI